MPSRDPATPAIRQLRGEGIVYEGHHYDYERHPGAMGAADALALEPQSTVKTIVFETSEGNGVLVLMNGDLEVSTKNLARVLRVKAVVPAGQRQARRWTGYEFGGTSPFGTRTVLPIYAHDQIARLEEIYINGGRRGYLVKIRTADLKRALQPRFEDLAI